MYHGFMNWYLIRPLYMPNLSESENVYGGRGLVAGAVARDDLGCLEARVGVIAVDARSPDDDGWYQVKSGSNMPVHRNLDGSVMRIDGSVTRLRYGAGVRGM